MSDKIAKFNEQIDLTVRKHGEMLQRRRDLSPEEKMELQAELTENAERAKAEFAEQVNAQEAQGESEGQSQGEGEAPGAGEGAGQGEGGMGAGEGGMGAGE